MVNSYLQGSDRRILRAFYTQYVAVLLLVLTFTVGAFQRAHSNRGSASAGLLSQKLSQSGEVAIPCAFTEVGVVNRGCEPLMAVTRVLSMHDLSAEVFVATPRLDFDPHSSSFTRTMRRVEALEDHFEDHDVPLRAVRIVAATDIEPAGDGALHITLFSASGGGR